MRRLALLAVVFLLQAQTASALILSCLPNRAPRTPGIDVYLDGFAKGAYPPEALQSLRVLVRFGADIYEFFPEQVQELSLHGRALRIHFLQPLSAGETAELRFEGEIAAKQGEPFILQMTIRNERRSGKDEVRCTIE